MTVLYNSRHFTETLLKKGSLVFRLRYGTKLQCTWQCHIANYGTARDDKKKKHVARFYYPMRTRRTQCGDNLSCPHWVIPLTRTRLKECCESSHKTIPDGCNWTRKAVPRAARHKADNWPEKQALLKQTTKKLLTWLTNMYLTNRFYHSYVLGRSCLQSLISIFT